MDKKTARKKLEVLKKKSPEDLEKLKVTTKIIKQMELMLDPMKWCEHYLRNPEDPGLPFVPRGPQKFVITNEHPKMVARTSRRTGKTVGIAAKAVYLGFTEPRTPILFLAPYKAQVQEIFTAIKLLITDTPLESSVKRFVEHPFYQIYLTNGSTIFGMTAGGKSSRRGSSARGQGAKYLFLDEFDFLPEDTIAAVLIVLKTRADSKLIITSNPSGARSYFYEWCTNPKKHGFVSKHFGREYIPNWTEEDDQFYKENYTTNAWNREVLGEFGEEMLGVFANRFIDLSLYEYEQELLVYNPQNAYVIGVDWNTAAIGTKIVVLEYIRNEKPTPSDKLFLSSLNAGRAAANREEKQRLYPKLPWDFFINKYRVFRCYSVESEEYTQVKAVEKVLELYKRFPPEFIYADAGYGDVQVELIKKFAVENNESRLAECIKGCNFRTTIEVVDPWSRKKVKKQLKSFMVNLAARTLEGHQFVLPASEDNKGTLVGQMRNYSITKHGPNPIYSEGDDHYLDAFMLAVLGFEINYGELKSKAIITDVSIFVSKSPIISSPGDGRNINRKITPGEKGQSTEGLLRGPASNAGMPYTYIEGTIPDYTTKSRKESKHGGAISRPLVTPIKRRFTGSKKWPQRRFSGK